MPDIDLRLFKAYDVRARTDALTPAAAQLIGQAIGTLAQERGFSRYAVARDGRLSSPALAAALVDGLATSGITVIDLGLAATPVLYFGASQLADGCGAVVTGSHNPPDYNGIKLMIGGEAIGGAALQALAQRIVAGELSQAAQPSQCTKHDIASAYTAAICTAVPQTRRLKLVIDCGNGVPGAIAPALFQALGHQVDALYCEVDGHFPNHHPDPQDPANLTDLIARVAATGADLGLAFDGDGDRLGIVTVQGAIVPGDALLALFAQALLPQQPGALVLHDVKSSRLVARCVATAGGHCVAIPTGHTHMKRELKARGALLAGELSGHYAFAGWNVDDALYAAARLTALVGAGLDLDAGFARLPVCHSTPELQLAVPDAAAELTRILATAAFPTAVSTSDIDGLRIEYPDGFGLIRKSNTTPVLTLRAEGDDAVALARIVSELTVAIAPLRWPG
ncbi:phosphomannomutase/phosphoglucomutase [Chitinolyticbacter meiyuanensis]|uniref:phosphomannomutase/phosphoglucomutase n=1 Tax=Chitinolyticbacter meiyuanensis TaxID=682798 RepID=UPI0011E5E2D4|nr:phosphomannomutase/phosphoglucomutase [Chitinolyticbacter meiyuanensis]